MTWEAAMRWALLWAKREGVKHYVYAVPPYAGRWTYAVSMTRPMPLDLMWPRRKA